MLDTKIARWLSGILFVTLLAIGAGSWYAVHAKRQDLETRAAALTRGDPQRGRRLAQSKGCVGCHEIPRTDGPQGNVGPSLAKMGTRVYIAGVLLNTPDHLVQWLLDPPRIDPKTAMPNVGLSEQEGRDLAAFLYTLD
jgi:cytochrome c